MLNTDDNAWIAIGSQLHTLEPYTARTVRQLNKHTNVINCIVFCSELAMVITTSRDHTACVWMASTGECVHVLEGHTSALWCAEVHGTKYVSSIYFLPINTGD